jgi:hypothetical protein
MNERADNADEMIEMYVEEQKLSPEVHNRVSRAFDKEAQSLVAVKVMGQG